MVQKQESCYSSYCGDLAPALLVLEAKVLLRRNKDSREIPLHDFFSGDGRVPLTLEPGRDSNGDYYPRAFGKWFFDLC